MSRRHAVDKDLNDLLRKAERAGWNVTKQGNGHVRVISPDGVVNRVVSSTPRTSTAWHLLRREMQRAGVIT